MAYLEYGCGPLPNPGLIPCGRFKRGAISAIGILDESAFGSGGLDFQTDLDWSNSAKYIQSINAGRLAIIAKIRGNVPNASPNDVDNPVGCGPQSITTAYDFTVSWVDANTTSATINFYSQLNKRITGLILFIPASDEVYVITSPTNFVCNPINVPSSNRELQKFNCIARTTFAPDSLPRKFYAPSNADQIFQSCSYPSATPPALGSQMEGGYVFHVEEGQRLAYVMSDTPYGPTYEWGWISGNGVNVPAVQASATTANVTLSCANTAAIVAATTLAGAIPNAATVCSNLTLNGYSDWCLPTFRALSVPPFNSAWYYMYNSNPVTKNLLDSNPGTYWSSNQINASSAVCAVLNGSSLAYSPQLKNSFFSHWPIRSFLY